MRRSDPTGRGAETGKRVLWHQRRRAGEVREGFVGVGLRGWTGVVWTLRVTWGERKMSGWESEERGWGGRELGEPLFGSWDLEVWSLHIPRGPHNWQNCTWGTGGKGPFLQHIYRTIISLGTQEGCLSLVKKKQNKRVDELFRLIKWLQKEYLSVSFPKS